MAAFKLPRLPVNWKEQPGLFERYWDEVLRNLETTIGAIISIPAIEAALADLDAAVASAQASADAAASNAALAQTSADTAQTSADLATEIAITVDTRTTPARQFLE